MPGDGRELVVTLSDAVKVRAEDGRRVEATDISPFISNLPFGGCAPLPAALRSSVTGKENLVPQHKISIEWLHAGKDTTMFRTPDASGSTSQAANIQEALELGASALLLDEDVCATNFMIRDARMQVTVTSLHLHGPMNASPRVHLAGRSMHLRVQGICGDMVTDQESGNILQTVF